MTEYATPKLALTIEEAAEALGLSTRTVERLVATGELRSRKIGRRRIIAMAELQRFLSGDEPNVVAPKQPM